MFGSALLHHLFFWVPQHAGETHVPPRLTRATYSCCCINFFKNPAHALTEVVFQVAHCEGVVAFVDFCNDDNNDFRPLSAEKANSNMYETLKSAFLRAFGISVTSTSKCHAHHSLHVSKEHTKNMGSAYYMMHVWRQHKNTYNTNFIGEVLREFRSKLLGACGILGIESAKKREGISLPTPGYLDSSRHAWRPSKRVLIIQRAFSDGRRITNIDGAMRVCEGLGLSCRIFFAGILANMSEVCAISRLFQDALVVGVQGAELIFSFYTGARHLLVRRNEIPISQLKFDFSKTATTTGLNTTRLKGKQIMPGVVARGCIGLDGFYCSFAFFLGVEVTHLQGRLVPGSVAAYQAAYKQKQQCNITPDFCGDLEMDLVGFESYLREKISEGALWKQ